MGKDVVANTSSNTMLEPAFAQMIVDNDDAFSNGFRIGSPIELLRFRRFAAENFGNEILTDEELIKSILLAASYLWKVYVIGNGIESKIRNNVDLEFQMGRNHFYSSFYARHEEWLFAGGVISEEMLKEILVKMYPNMCTRQNTFTLKAETVQNCPKSK